jgi:predicted negative regulator of RcsB-dependent stress response
VSTTKLTRKEILTEDPVHETMIRIVEFLRHQGKLMAAVALVAVLIGVGVYFLLEYLDAREGEGQRHLARAMAMFHGNIDPAAPDDPFGKGPDPVFRTEAARYQAALKEFRASLDRQGSSKLGVIARYYVGLSQLELGQTKEAIQNLEQVKNNTKDRTVGYLARKVLAKQQLESGNAKAAQELLEGMIQDPQCDLPKEELRLELGKAYASEGKRDQALKVLRQARDESSRSLLLGAISREISKLEGTAPARP